MKRLLLATAFAVATATPAAAITFTYTGSIVSWIVPADGIYSIEAVGAQGGAAVIPEGAELTQGPNGPRPIDTQYEGGRGAMRGVAVTLKAGTVLHIAVGGMGHGANTGYAFGGGGGGGGSFVVAAPGTSLTATSNLPAFYLPGITATPTGSLFVTQEDTLLLAAGGGGGVSSLAFRNGWDASTGTSGLTASIQGITPGSLVGGGTPLPNYGLGGPKALQLIGGAGGAGFYGNGQDIDTAGQGGQSWANGLIGGTGCPIDPQTGKGGGYGGFGGGGGVSGCFGYDGGGGGGYSGGEGGFVGGGGGSFYESYVNVGPSWFIAGVGYGNGLVTIEEVITEPASATLALLGLFGLAALRRRA
jgi:hypothetical protein